MVWRLEGRGKLGEEGERREGGRKRMGGEREKRGKKLAEWGWERDQALKLLGGLIKEPICY